MTIDVRATVSCNLGPLISLTVSDSYAPAGGGLITTRGEIVLDTVETFNTGQSVTVTWVNVDGVTKTLPRSLVVVSSNVDPLAKTTTVAVGCRLSFTQDWQAFLPIEQESDVQRGEFVPPELTWWKSEQDVPADFVDAVTGRAATAVNAGGTVPLADNAVWIIPDYEDPTAEWEFSSSYVSTLGTILTGFGKFGAMSSIGALQEVAWGSSQAKFYDESSVISVSPLGVGSLPARRYRAYYSYNALQEEFLQLEQPTEDCTEVSGEELTRTVRYRTDDDLDDPDNELTEASFTYSFTPSSRTCIYRDEYGREYMTVETVQEYGLLDSYAALLASCGFLATAESAAGAARTKITTTTRTYDEANHVISEIVEVTHDRNAMLGVLDLPYATAEYKDSAGSIIPAELHVAGAFAGRFTVERIERTTGPDFQDIKITTRRWVAFGYTPDGQQAAAEQGRETKSGSVMLSILADAEQLIEQPVEWQVIENAAKQWNDEIELQKYIGSMTTTSGTNRVQRKVSLYPLRNYMDLAASVPGAEAGATKVVSLPVAPDQELILKTTTRYVDGTSEIDVKSVTNSAAQVAARRHVDMMQRVEYGIRYGLSLQVSADTIPAEHLFSVLLRVGTAAGAYVATAVTWTADSNGIVASFDALYTGMAGGTGAAFGPVVTNTFPPLPDVATDPDIGPVVDWGDVTLVPPYNLELPIEGGIGIGVEAYRLDYDVARTQTAEVGIGVGVEAQVAP